MSFDLDGDQDLDTPFFDLDGDQILHTFTPPTSTDMGPVNPDTTGLQRRLFGYYSPHARGHNIWKLADGTFTDDVQPWPLITPDDAAKGNLPLGVAATAVTYQKVYYGGHANVITDQEAADLTAAGYGAFIT